MPNAFHFFSRFFFFSPPRALLMIKDNSSFKRRQTSFFRHSAKRPVSFHTITIRVYRFSTVVSFRLFVGPNDRHVFDISASVAFLYIEMNMLFAKTRRVARIGNRIGPSKAVFGIVLSIRPGINSVYTDRLEKTRATPRPVVGDIGFRPGTVSRVGTQTVKNIKGLSGNTPARGISPYNLHNVPFSLQVLDVLHFCLSPLPIPDLRYRRRRLVVRQ